MKKLSFIIPYRNREKHLETFLYHIPTFLLNFENKFDIIIVNQADDKLFNRAKLLNIGTLFSDADYYVLHDVDMVPLEADYSYVETPTHLSARISEFNYKLPYQTYFGGITLINKDDFNSINGLSNEYWGWGGEDDDLYQRITQTKLKPDRRNGKFLCLPHEKIGGGGNPNHKNNVKRLNQMTAGLIKYQSEGVKQTKYKLIKEEKLKCPVNCRMYSVEI